MVAADSLNRRNNRAASQFRLTSAPEKRQVIEERLINWHPKPEALLSAMAEVAAVFERRNLVARGVLSQRPCGALCIKSFSAARFTTEDSAIDIIDLPDLAAWSEKASDLSERLIALGTLLRDMAP